MYDAYHDGRGDIQQQVYDLLSDLISVYVQRSPVTQYCLISVMAHVDKITNLPWWQLFDWETPVSITMGCQPNHHSEETPDRTFLVTQSRQKSENEKG